MLEKAFPLALCPNCFNAGRSPGKRTDISIKCVGVKTCVHTFRGCRRVCVAGMFMGLEPGVHQHNYEVGTRT